MSNPAERFRNTFNVLIEQAQTSRRALAAEAAGAVMGFAGAFVVETPLPAIALAAIGFGSAVAGYANVEYQDAVRWQPTLPETPAQ
jgi:hypothetical protein